METKIIKIGNSFGVRIPLCELKRLKKGKDDVVNIKILTRKELIEEEKNEKKASTSGMSKELASLIVHDSDNGDRGFNLNEARGFLNMGSRNVNRIIGEGLTHNWLIRQVRGREVFYDASINGKSEAYSVLNVDSSIMNSVETCLVCGTPFNRSRNKECPVCDRELKEQQRIKDLKVTESDFITNLRSELEVHKAPVEGNPVLDECRSLAVLEDINLPMGIVLPERKSVVSCEVERYGEDVPLRAADLNKGFQRVNREIEVNGALIPVFKKKILGDCPKQLYDEYATVCDILFQQDCKILDSQTWRFRAGMFLDRNSKILPGLKGKKEKVEFLCAETGNVLKQYVDFRLEAERVAAGKVG